MLLGPGELRFIHFVLPLFLSFFTLPVAYLIQLINVIDGICAGDVNRHFTAIPRLIYPVPFTW